VLVEREVLVADVAAAGDGQLVVGGMSEIEVRMRLQVAERPPGKGLKTRTSMLT
jgi:hypothetical protein